MQSSEVLFRLEGVRRNFVVLSPVGLPRSVAGLSRAGKAEALQRLQAAEAWLMAEKVGLALGMAGDSRADSPDGEVDEFFVDGLAVVLNCSRAAATALYLQAGTLAGRLPATLAALRAGGLDWPRAGRSPRSWVSRPTAAIRGSWRRWRRRCCRARAGCRSAG